MLVAIGHLLADFMVLIVELVTIEHSSFIIVFPIPLEFTLSESAPKLVDCSIILDSKSPLTMVDLPVSFVLTLLPTTFIKEPIHWLEVIPLVGSIAVFLLAILVFVVLLLLKVFVLSSIVELVNFDLAHFLQLLIGNFIILHYHSQFIIKQFITELITQLVSKLKPEQLLIKERELFLYLTSLGFTGEISLLMC